MKKENIYKLLIAILILIPVIIIVVGMYYSKIGYIPENGQIELKTSSLIMVQGSALIAVVPPSIFRPDTLGVMVEKVIDCESKGIHYNEDGTLLVGDLDKKYQAFGKTQIQKRTFLYLSEKTGVELNWDKEEDHEWLLSWSIENNWGCHWSCYQWITGECN